MNNEETLNDLLVIIDKKIEDEKGNRDLTPSRSEAWTYQVGRIDGVDAARFLIEKYFSMKEQEA